MKIKIEIGDESLEEFEKICDAIIRDIVELRCMPTDEGQYMRYSLERIARDDLETEINLTVRRVKCRHVEDF